MLFARHFIAHYTPQPSLSREVTLTDATGTEVFRQTLMSPPSWSALRCAGTTRSSPPSRTTSHSPSPLTSNQSSPETSSVDLRRPRS